MSTPNLATDNRVRQVLGVLPEWTASAKSLENRHRGRRRVEVGITGLSWWVGITRLESTTVSSGLHRQAAQLNRDGDATADGSGP